MSSDELGIKLVAEGLAEFKRTLDRAQSAVDGFADEIGRVDTKTRGLEGASLFGFGAMQTAANLAADAIKMVIDRVGEVAAKTITVASDFESQMALMEIAAGGTAEEMEVLREYAIEMGAKTFESAQGAAEGMTNLLKAGLTAKEVMTVFPAVADLAAASGLSLGEASDAMTVAISTFGIDVNEASDITDLFVKSADASVAEVEGLVQALSTGGPTAALFGMTFAEFNAALAIFSERGIKGAEAGTMLKSMLLGMNQDTKKVKNAWGDLGLSMYDSEGNMRRIYEVVGDLAEKLDLESGKIATMFTYDNEGEKVFHDFVGTQEQIDQHIKAYEDLGYTLVGVRDVTEEYRNTMMKTLAGSYGIGALSTLMTEGSAGWDEMNTKMREAASAAEIAATRFDTLNGAVEEAQGGLETLMIQAGTPLIDSFLRPLVDTLNTDVLPAVNKFVGTLIGTDSLHAALSTIIGDGDGDRLATMVLGIATAVDGLFADLGSGASLHDALLDNLGIDITVLENLFNNTTEFLGGIGENFERFFATIDSMDPEQLDALGAGLVILGAGVAAVKLPAIIGLAAGILPLAGAFAAFGGVTAALPDIAEFLANLGGIVQGVLGGNANQVLENVSGGLQNLAEAVGNFGLGATQALLDLLGIDLDVEGGIAAWAGFMGDLQTLITRTVTGIRQEFERIFDGLRIGILGIVRDVVKAIGDTQLIDMSGPLADLDTQISDAKERTTAAYQLGAKIANDVTAGYQSGQGIDTGTITAGLATAFSEGGIDSAQAFYDTVAATDPPPDVIAGMQARMKILLGQDLAGIIAEEGVKAGQAYVTNLAREGVDPDVLRGAMQIADPMGEADIKLPALEYNEEDLKAQATEIAGKVDAALFEAFGAAKDEESQKAALREIISAGLTLAEGDPVLDEALKAGGEVSDAVFSGLKQGITEKTSGGGGLLDWSPTVSLTYDELMAELEAGSPAKKFVPPGESIVGGIGLGATESEGVLSDALSGVLALVLESGANEAAQFQTIGAAMVEGIRLGIAENSAGMIAQVVDVTGAAVDATRQVLGIASPSKVYQGFGQDMGAGLGAGMLDTFGYLEGVGEKMGAQVMGATRAAVPVYGGGGVSNIDKSTHRSMGDMNMSFYGVRGAESAVDRIRQAGVMRGV